MSTVNVLAAKSICNYIKRTQNCLPYKFTTDIEDFRDLLLEKCSAFVRNENIDKMIHEMNTTYRENVDMMVNLFV